MLAPALTILLSSFLLFLVQPILAKQILPWFGGSAAVWTVCLVFFQSMLVLGYSYAHLLTRRWVGSRQFGVHIALLLVSCLVLPIIPSSFWKDDRGTEPALRILLLLATTVGLPYLLLSSTGPLLQRWLATADETAGNNRSIYRLFALSNLGSLIGLLCYPFAIEPLASLHSQTWAWSAAYALFVVCSISYAWRRRRLPNWQHGRTVQTAPPVPPARRNFAYWIACSALGAALLLSATNHLTQNVAAIPLLWIVPLSMYLLSFVICFEGRYGRGWYERRIWVTPAMLATGTMAYSLFADAGNLSAYVAVPVFTAGVLLGCVVCHGELARTRPSSEYLTQFYLTIAAGGALGGLLVGLMAPRIFDGYWEMPLALAALSGLCLHCCFEDSYRRARRPLSLDVCVALIATGLILLLVGHLPAALDTWALPWAKIGQGDARWGLAALLVLSAPLLQRYHLWRAAALTALASTLTFDWLYYHELTNHTELQTRNFYGALRVIEMPYGAGNVRQLMHGTILHGSEVMQPPQEREIPTTYYGETSGIGRALSCEHRMRGTLRIGSVGLGAGTLAAYGKPGDVFRVYEINPAVLDVAKRQFDYLGDSKARVEPVLGDARLSLESELAEGEFDKPEERYDVVSLDAFSGDAIPIHLLTREAFATYAQVTKPDGVIAFHLSNRFLNLPPIVGQIAQDSGFHAVLVNDRPVRSGLTNPSTWVLVTRNTAFLRQPDIANYSVPLTPQVGLAEWTDQFSNLLQILK